MKPLNLSGTPSRSRLLAEARRRGYSGEPVRRTGEVRMIAPHGRVTASSRRKDGSRALVALLRSDGGVNGAVADAPNG